MICVYFDVFYIDIGSIKRMDYFSSFCALEINTQVVKIRDFQWETKATSTENIWKLTIAMLSFECLKLEAKNAIECYFYPVCGAF